MENINTEVNAQVSAEVSFKTSSQEQVLTYEDGNGNIFKYKTMPNKPLTWVQELERNYA